MPEPPENVYEFDCPLCGGAFEASAEHFGQQVECPHCEQVVELPEIESTPDSPPAESPTSPPPQPKTPPAPEQVAQKTPKPEPPPEPEPEPRRQLTREEKAAARRKFNMILAAIGAVLLMIVFLVLANLSA